MKKTILFLAIMIFNQLCFGQSFDSSATPEFHQIKTMSGFKYQLFSNGSAVNEVLYDEVKSFHEGLAAVKRDDKWSFVNRNGNEIIPPTFHDVSDFKNGFAIVMNNKLDKGFINNSGKLITPIKYFSARFFEEGYAAIAFGTYPNLKWGFINVDGKEVILPKYTGVSDFKDGISKVSIKDKVGFINNTGKEITQIIYYDYGSNHLGNGIISLTIDVNNRTSFEGVINSKGDWIFKKGQLSGAKSFSDKYFIIEKGGNKYGISDHNGNIKVEVNFMDIRPISEEFEGLFLGRLYLERGVFFYVDSDLNCVNMEGSPASPCP
jgi:hypothetical protein